MGTGQDVELSSPSPADGAVKNAPRTGPVVDSDTDTLALARLGKEEVLTVRYDQHEYDNSLMGVTAALWPCFNGRIFLWVDVFLGGNTRNIYAWIFKRRTRRTHLWFFVTWLGTLSVFVVMGELASMIPTAGGQYHWVSLLAPASAQRFLSYIAGWITVTGWVAGTAATAFFVSSLIQALLVLNLDDYEPLGWQGTLLFWAIMLVCVIMNTALSKALPAIEVAILILHILGFFVILVPLAWLAPTTSASNVFQTWQDAGGWDTQALSFIIGLNGNAVAFIGTDGPIHMAEEVQNATKNVPRSMILGTIINGLLAFAMLLVTLFHAGNIEEAFENAPNGFPFITIFATGINSKAGATAMVSLVLILILCSAAGGLAASSRMVWSFARDRDLPGHMILGKVDRRTTIPLAAVLVVFTCAFLMGLINIGNTTAFNAVVSMVLEGFYTSYLLACSMLLYRRCRGDIREPDTDPTMKRPYEWGPWRVRGMLGVINNVVACGYLILIAFFSFWPTTLPVTLANMNYSSLVLGTVAIFSMGYYLLFAKRSYTGPVVEVRLARAGLTLEPVR